MFEHVTVLLSFVFAIALTHLLTSSTELIWARDRLRFSGLQALWMLSAALSILVNWIGLEPLSAIKQWSVSEIEVQFAGAIVQYYTCSLISMRPKDDGIVDMRAFYKRERPAIFSAYSALLLVSMFQNWWDSGNFKLDLVGVLKINAVVLGMMALTLGAGWASRNGFNGQRHCLC